MKKALICTLLAAGSLFNNAASAATPEIDSALSNLRTAIQFSGQNLTYQERQGFSQILSQLEGAVYRGNCGGTPAQAIVQSCKAISNRSGMPRGQGEASGTTAEAAEKNAADAAFRDCQRQETQYPSNCDNLRYECHLK